MCCEGKEINYQDLRTPEQVQLMQALAPLLTQGIGKGATPFGGMLSQPPDPSMLAAMNVMMNVGGQGNYRFPGMMTGPYPQPPQPQLNGGGGGGGTRGGGSPGITPDPRRWHPWETGYEGQDPFDPYKRMRGAKER